MEEILEKEKNLYPSKKWFRMTLVVIGVFYVFAVLVQIFLINLEKTQINSYFGGFIKNAVINPTYWIAYNFQNLISKNAPKQVINSVPTNLTEVQINSDGARVYPVQYNNLWGHEFYTSKIDQSGSVDIESESKQKIANLLNALGFPASLTRSLIFVHIDPTVVKQTDRLEIPWLPNNIPSFVSPSLQPQGGTYQNVYGGSIIALNNLVGFNPAVLTHELGHLIGYQLTDQEWAQYYKLRGIPNNTSRNLSDWKLSPQEDFAEVYKNTYKQGDSSEWNVTTQYGTLVPTSDYVEFSTPCYTIKQKLIDNYISKYRDPNHDPLDFSFIFKLQKEAENAIQANSELQSCRRKNNGVSPFGGPIYMVRVSEATKQFVKSVIAILK